ncbi:hypothetical protein SLE2022_031000 [Rubroshorea leprosula]
MGIHKVPYWNSEVSSFQSHLSYGRGMEDNPVSGADSADDLDDCDSTESGCELGMVEGQLCSIPYELFDLPDLRGILSVDTWNSCLTEEERYSLSAYLPDMDQQNFWLTMSELLGGSDIYFGNPMDMFFKRLKAGFYPPKVARLRESLLFLQRRKHYHSLISYHDKMVQMFIDMRRAWDQCDQGTGVGARLNIWKTRRKCKDVNLLDLNTVPKDGTVSSGDDELICHLSKRMKGMLSVRADRVLPTPSAKGKNFISPNCTAKGVLKVKASGSGSIYNQSNKIILGDVVDQFQPKGLLKIVPKIPPFYQSEQSKFASRQPPPVPMIGAQVWQDRKFCSLPPSTYLWKRGGISELPLLWQNVGGSKAHATSDQPSDQPQYILSQLDDTLGGSRYSHSSDKNINREVESSDLGKCKLFGHDVEMDPNEESESLIDMIGAKRHSVDDKYLWQKFDMGSTGFSDRYVGSYPFSTQYHDLHQRTRALQNENSSIHSRIPAGVSRTSDVGIGMPAMSLPPSNQIKSASDIRNEKSKGCKDEHMLPLTYKRRKSQAKLKSSGIGNKLMKGSDTDMRSGNPEEANQ